MPVARIAPEFKKDLIQDGFTNGESACMELVFGGTPEALWVDIKVVRKRDRLPLVEVARVHGLAPNTTVTLDEITNAFNITLTTT